MRQRSTKILLVWTMLVMLMGFSDGGFAQVNVNIGIGVPLPSVVIPSPPPVVLIPATYVYFVPDISVDILFYHGYWYRPHHAHYYRATSYNGPWVSVASSSVPKAVLHVPSDFHRVPPGHQRIPYGELKKNWEIWEKEKYWDKHPHVEQTRAASTGGKGDNKQGKGGGKGKHKD